MTTDLRDKTVEELRAYRRPITSAGGYWHADDFVHIESFDELSRRLAESEHTRCPCGNPADSKETRALCSAGTCYGCLSDRLAEAEQKIAERDAMLIGLQDIIEDAVMVAVDLSGEMHRETVVARTKLWKMALESLPASAKANAEILRVAKDHLAFQATTNDIIGDRKVVCGCCICKAVRAAEEIK